MPRTIHFVLNAALPHKKAYGIQAAHMAQAFIEQGVSVIFVTPHAGSEKASLKDFYKLRVEIEVARVPAINWFNKGKFWFFVSTATFMISAFVYLFVQRLRGELQTIYTVDMDPVSFTFLPFLGVPVYSEVHARKTSNFFSRTFFKRVSGVITVNTHVAQELKQVFGMATDRVITDINGVEDSWLLRPLSLTEARSQLNIPQDARVATFVGRFYGWKGLDILPKAFALASDIDGYMVGGSRAEFQHAVGDIQIPANLHFPGEVENYDVPLWLTASDALLVVWPKHQDSYYANMTPMKIFEYMALRRPVVAANDLAITDGIKNGEAILYEPGDAEDLAQKVRLAIEGDNAAMLERAHALASHYALSKRAKRILMFMHLT